MTEIKLSICTDISDRSENPNFMINSIKIIYYFKLLYLLSHQQLIFEILNFKIHIFKCNFIKLSFQIIKKYVKNYKT